MSRIVAEIIGSNLISFIIWSFLELIIFSMFYLNFINKRKVWSLAILGILYMLIEFIYVDSNAITTFQSYAKVVTSGLMVIMVFIYFFEQIKGEFKMGKQDVYLHSSILSYFALEFILLLPMNFLIDSGSDLVFYVWMGHLLVLILFYLYLTNRICKNGKSQKRLHYGL
ncbi:hypothetical protein [Aquimarina sp. 2201CG5-10]|uniref:hypothetical protein n=1 Tax=Aquimarina callyspongiae TaxID=3098150 RepID=UPI002AB376E0|nr:hypothetical protein [Aquimarina sp. 2201CG5-10]MDY8138129.1 hypothetical protein [Aquimarina sp. 2201CG5-10]